MKKLFPLLLAPCLAFASLSLANTGAANPESGQGSNAGPARTSPNVILILADDMALGDLASLNGGRSRTPHLDRLMSQSMWFRNAYSASPVCAPARAALLTGRYPHRTGAVTLNMEKYPALSRIRVEERTLADIFRANGYVTGLVGKWHSGLGEAYHPLARGFDEFEGFIGHLDVPSYFRFKLRVQRETREFTDSYLTDELSQRAIGFVRRHREEPFFLHLAHYAPHRPIEAPEERIRPYLDAGLDKDTSTVYAMIEIMDEGIGKLLAEIEKLGLREDTITIFASDNGPDPLVAPRFNLELRGTKYEVHEGGIRVPFFWHRPGHESPGKSDALVHFCDVVPTLIDVCRLDPRLDLPLDGVSFRTSLSGDTGEPPSLRFWQWNRFRPSYSHNAAIREADWKLVRPFVTRNVPRSASTAPPLLFNLADDPSESIDLSARHPDRVERMNAALERWTREIERDRTR